MCLLSVRYILVGRQHICAYYFSIRVCRTFLKKKKKIDPVHYISCWITYLSHLFINTGYLALKWKHFSTDKGTFWFSNWQTATVIQQMSRLAWKALSHPVPSSLTKVREEESIGRGCFGYRYENLSQLCPITTGLADGHKTLDRQIKSLPTPVYFSLMARGQVTKYWPKCPVEAW